MITLYIVRHGTTEYNTLRRIQGQIDTPLTDEGYKNAFIVADRFRDMDVKFDHIYSSDLGRAFITAHVIAERLDLENRVIRERRLRETNYGAFTGKPIDELLKIPGFKGNANFVPDGGESFLDMQKRVISFIKELERKHYDKTTLIVTHAGCIKSTLGYFNSIEPDKSISLKICNEYIGKFVIEKGKLVCYEKVNGA